MTPVGYLFQAMSDVEELVRGFEDCTLPKSEWHHQAHLVVAIWYVSFLPEVEATERVIAGIQRYNRAKGTTTAINGGYHETLTLFWLAIAQHFVSNADPGTSFVQRVNDFVEQYGDRKDLIREYYSNEHICSCRARQTWVEPDLKPLAF